LGQSSVVFQLALVPAIRFKYGTKAIAQSLTVLYAAIRLLLNNLSLLSFFHKIYYQIVLN
jgi:hypothetical protein